MSGPSTATTRWRRTCAPVTEPPYDDESGYPPPSPDELRARRQSSDITIQHELALSITTSGGIPSIPRPGGRPGQDNRLADDDVAPGLPEPRRWCAMIAQAVVETLYGQRPVQQLARWTTADVYGDLVQRAVRRRTVGPGAAPTVRTVRLCMVRADVVEASAVIQTGTRARALAVRLESRDTDHWLCAAAELV
ncbi:hypothetical protein EF847_04445 [Actinobacteria bacterium YIM 96077]|uniref:3-hydroxyacyl-CoA dehydrogenase n=1 Tax=Phytoactinopolyspora halophila TaxID=1981511 RepID=A0A329R235_9ACTN|nr:Rv3235 family protein [Phytoactinopolyspora halophila]AYY12071.1 hypothetical protein EF847_04445 [Actinobacteria bacterium YIM 96077]RAW18695.1 hypothetical protein DPM12_01065 [Phytoactinopolyspora halophila]